MKRLLALLVVPLLAIAGAVQAEAAGRLDPSFGKGGRLLLSSKLVPGHETATLPDGRIVLGGPKKMLALLPSGKIDSSFGEGGFVPFQAPSGHPYTSVNDLAVDSQGRLIVAGSTSSTEDGGFLSEVLIARYTSVGQLDPSFGTSGFTLSDFGFPPPGPPDFGSVLAHSVAVDGDDRIVLGGERQTGWKQDRVGPIPTYEPYVARLTPEGEVDGSFAGSGVLRLDKFERVGKPLLDAGGIYFSASARREFLIRRQESGAADPWFGDDGRQWPPEGTEAHTITSDDTGRLLLFGYLRGSRERRLANGVLVKRLHPDGSLDLSFGRNGVSSLRLPRLGSAVMAAGAGGEVFVAAEILPRKRPGRRASASGMMLARLRPSGGLDRSFGRGGTVEIRFKRDTKTSVHTLLVSESQALVGGTWCAPRGCSRVLARVDLGGR